VALNATSNEMAAAAVARSIALITRIFNMTRPCIF
jgi:hypothetical protein